MRILAFSDWRVQRISDIFDFFSTLNEPVDLILYAGDDIDRFKKNRVNYFSKLADKTTMKKVLVVKGNDDIFGKGVLRGKNVHDLHEEPYIYKNFAFLGSEAATSGPGLTYPEKYVKKHLEGQFNQVNGKKLVIVSHSPPYGILDYGIRFASQDKGTHNIGSKSLRKFIQQHSAKLVICGHCHSQGTLSYTFGNTMVANVSSHDDPGAKGNFALIDLNENSKPIIQWYDTFSTISEKSLRKIHGIGFHKCQILESSGIKSIKQFVAIKNLDKISKKTNFSQKNLEHLQLKAKSLLEKKIFQTSTLSLPTKNMIFFDIETDTACKKVWLIGILDNNKFKKMYAKNWNEEKKLLKSFLKFLEKKQNSVLVSFSGISFDWNVINKALARLKMDSAIFHSIPHIDLCQLLRQSFIFPNQSYALKDLGAYLDYPFKHQDLNGLWVASEYQNHLSEKRRLDRSVFEYNKDDVKTIPYILTKLKNDGYEIVGKEQYVEKIKQVESIKNQKIMKEVELFSRYRNSGFTLEQISQKFNRSIFYIYSRLNSRYRPSRTNRKYLARKMELITESKST